MPYYEFMIQKKKRKQSFYHNAALPSLAGTAMDILPISAVVPAQIIADRPSLIIEQETVSDSSGISTAIWILLKVIL